MHRKRVGSTQGVNARVKKKKRPTRTKNKAMIVAHLI